MKLTSQMPPPTSMMPMKPLDLTGRERIEDLGRIAKGLVGGEVANGVAVGMDEDWSIVGVVAIVRS